MDQRSVLTSLFGAIGNLPQGHDKPIKLAIYNAVALFLVFLCCATSWGLYMVLQPFIKPLMWALLVGSALHPLKRSLRDRFQNWFKMLEDTNTPTILGLMLLPVNIFNELSECIGKFLWDRRKLIGIILIIIPLGILLYQFTPRITIQFLWILLNLVHKSLSFLINITSINLMIFILVGYLPLLLLYWDKNNNKYFHYGCIIMWFLLSCCAAQQFNDQFKFPVFFLLEFIFLGGFINELYENYSNMLLNGQEISFTNLLSETFQCKELRKNIEIKRISSESDERDECLLKSKENITSDPWSLELFQHDSSSIKEKIKPKFARSISQPQFNLKNPKKLLLERKNSILNLPGCNVQNYESTFYLYSVMWCCLIMLIWKNLILLPLLPLPIFSYCIKHLGHYFGFWRYLEQKFQILFDAMQKWCHERHGALIPVPIKGIYRIIQKLNIKTKKTIKNSIDTVASCVVILGLIIFLISASIFTAIQIYAEGIMLVQMTSNVINQTVVQNPELRQLLPPTWDETMNSILDNAYQYGREGISKTVKSIMNNSDSVQSEKLETQILELWDRIYQSWMTSNETNGPKVTEEAVKNSWDDFLEDLKKSSDIFLELFNINGIVEFAKQNVGTLISLLESIWGLIISNLSLVLGSFSTCFQLILGGGTAVLNFILNMIVFLTTLFYLLNSSGNYYKPVELMIQFSPSGKRFGQALEAAINSVFASSLKMAIFYGMWTWLIHNLFNVKIVYLSSAFATILGAVPFLGTYWACVPGILDLWLSQDRWIAASLFAGFQFLPTSFVDTAIYSEIKGGHPYLTGLAIAGGIFCLGVEGALIGPLLLCALYVAIDLLSSNLFKDSPA